ncbi:SNF2 family N-terminal domain-containing protein [Xylogone sp. PMI_703]|nr:SNF2 family N-terminal domain-containing protein [Xylogone sp. PMI_703]
MAEPWTSISSGAAAAEKDHYMFVHIVLYGFQEHLQKVGDILDTRKVYLQEPDFRDMQFDYKNPHFIDLSSINLSTTSDLGPLTSSLLQIDFNFQQQQALDEQGITQALLKQKVMAAFNTTTRAQTLKRVGADSKIRTKLLPYQEEALDFIMQRESGPTPEEYCLWRSDDFVSYVKMKYKHAITGCEINEIPTETGGGILADEMGLGKTLTMLSAIIGTAAEANTFALSSQNSTHLNVEQNLIHSRATLIVVPSPLLLNEWLEEIKRHCTGFSNITIYHSHGRESNPRVLADSDLILSTYHTIAAESTDKMSPLWQISWYRIVLDEAHVIRRMATKLSKAMRKLHGLLRWCLTGTPIQNSLEDLAALVNFIRSSPLDNLHNFKKHIISPIMRKSESGIENLRKLLDSVCLRRTKELLGLPEIILESQLLSFSISEKKRYIDTRDKLISLINQNSLQPQNRGYLGVFQLQLQLRRLCNHGTFQKPSLGSEEFDPDQAMSLLRKHKRAKCDSCGIKITGIHGIEEQKNGSFTVCGHLLCSSCIPKMKQALRKVDGENSHPQCSLCSETIFAEYIMTEEASSASSARVGRHLSAWQYFDKDGCSTKVSAVVTDIEQNKTDSKSIVFSCWTRSLDLIGIFLTSRKLKFVRIDGSHTIGQRKRILEIYQKDPEIQILLMTTGTGAVGLNLTVASSVYILEPQWNPMVESQAIARVNRLGQTKPVRVIRYIMKDTVEQVR